jgi:predicted transcriptional regulator of viral defense system
MKFEELLDCLGSQGWFDLASVVQLARRTDESIIVQLHRWCKAGKLIPLRRGMYAFSEKYRRTRIYPAQLANRIYAPSYLSTHWAFGFYGMIPEMVVTYTSVTSRVPKTFSNELGTFAYRHLKSEAFFGYRCAVIDSVPVLLADPEKALLDFWHLERGVWNKERMAEMRFQHFELIQPEKLLQYAKRFASPRLMDAVRIWTGLASADREGMVEL